MPNEIKTFSFEAHALTFERRDGEEWWADFKEITPALGYTSPKAVERLFARHRSEFLEHETCTVTLTVQGQGRKVRLFSVRGLEHLATLGRTETCVRFRRWLLDIAEQLRSGARVVTEEQMRAAISTAVEQVASQFRAIITQQAATITALSGAVQTQASNAGRLLSYMSRTPEIKRALAEAEDERNGQTKLPFVTDGNVIRLDGAAS